MANTRTHRTRNLYHDGQSYALCEPMMAYRLWHIRHLTKTGLHLGGGADTESLCGREMAWDLDVNPDSHIGKDHVCPRCTEAFRNA